MEAAVLLSPARVVTAGRLSEQNLLLFIWKGKILLLESSEEIMPPEKYERALYFFKEAGLFSSVNGVLVGKPVNEIYSEEYKRLLKKVIDDPGLPVVTNLNVGHALPRCIVPFGRRAEVDINNQEIRFQ